ncbi:MAG: non-ribosomal peptide synthetase [Archangium sp.]
MSRAEGVTPFMTLLTGFHALLSRYSGQRDFVVGSPLVGRNRREVEGLIGCFLNTLALRVDGSGEVSFRELLGRVRKASLGAYAHQDMPFEHLVDALQPVRDLSRTPLFQVMFAHQILPPALELPGLSLDDFSFESGVAKFDLALYVRETPDGLVSLWEYNTDLYDEATVARMGAHYARLLESALAQPEQSVSALPLLNDEERHHVLVEWNQTRTRYPRNASVHELFEAHVARRPEAVAAEYEGQVLSYAELNLKANQVARHLRRLGVTAGSRVGLCAGRSLEMVAATLGILKAGGAYVPLDPAYPSERLAFMLEDTAVPVVLAQPELASKLPPMSARVVALSWETFAHESGENLGEKVGPEAMAYVMYTSGSTGKPKGVCIPHRGIVRLVRDTNFIQVTAEDRFTQMANTAFDAATLELWGALLNGASLLGVPREVALVPRALATFIREKQASVVFVTTALFNQVAAECPEAFQGVKYVMFGGEAADARWLREVLDQGSSAKLLNLYGPTESTTCATWHEVTEVAEGAMSVPIGKPVANTDVYVLDERMEPVPVGLAGELYVGGDGLALGYLNRPELTEEKFVAHPFSTQPDARLYRTGDLVRYLPDGSLEFLGRRDAQVKVRGFRIELGEVEAALAAHPGVGEVVVAARDDGPGGSKWLVAYVVAREGQEVEAGELRTFLKQTLPEHMVPSAFVKLEKLPLTPNGKVDRKALPAPESSRQELSRSYVGPRTGLEVQLARIWEELLGIQPIGVRDNFFELGGNSLLAVRLLSRIRASTGKSLPVAALFQNATVEHLAGLLRKEAGPWSPLVEFRGGKGKRPFFCVHAVGGTVLSYVELARLLGPEQPFYGLQARGLDGDQEPCGSVEEMAALYIEAMRSVQPSGPYLLGGWSMGGSIALEMAKQLQAQGEQVELLALIDSYDLSKSVARPPIEQQEASRLGAMFYRDLLKAAGQEMPVSEEALARMGPEELRGALEEASKAAAAVLGAGVQPLRALQRVFEQNLRAASSYVPGPYEGRITLFEASESSPRTQGTVRFAASEVELHEFGADHYSLLRSPRVEELAARLGECLARANAARPGTRKTVS